MILGLKDVTAYEASGWWNCLIGRYANRLKGGITVAGRHYPLAQDGNGVTLHGGRGQSWGARIWDAVQASDTSLTLRLVSPDGDQGFPGAMTVEVTYSLSEDGLRLDYAATTDANTAGGVMRMLKPVPSPGKIPAWTKSSTVNPYKAGLVLGSFVGLWHLAWSLHPSARRFVSGT